MFASPYRKSALLDFLSAKASALFTSLSLASPSPIRVSPYRKSASWIIRVAQSFIPFRKIFQFSSSALDFRSYGFRSLAFASPYRKSAFTFAELMVSLVIIAVITVILYPTISDLAPNNNKFLFKSAYKTIENIVADITASGDIPNTNATAMCQEFEKRLNVQGANNQCSDNSHQNAFRTTNGVKWFFVTSGDDIRIWVDVNASNNNIASQNTCTSGDNAVPVTMINFDKTGTPASSAGIFCNSTNNDEITRDTFYIDVTKTGKINVGDTIALRHLKDISQ